MADGSCEVGARNVSRETKKMNYLSISSNAPWIAVAIDSR